MAAQLSEALKQEVVYNAVPVEVYREFPFDGADDVGNMFQYERDFEPDFCGARDLRLNRELNPELLTFNAGSSSTAHKSRSPDEPASLQNIDLIQCR